jgi:hypothetical protein
VTYIQTTGASSLTLSRCPSLVIFGLPFPIISIKSNDPTHYFDSPVAF